ncbi:MAG: FHA domain-containing protein [Phycisphaerales bacterium JB058]
MEPTLLIVKEDGSSQEILLRKPRVVVGRESDCELRIPLPSVSRQHCEFVVEDGKVTVRDMGSSNGTYVNKERVEEAELSAGDLVAVGPAVFALIIEGEPSDLDVKEVFVRGNVAVKPKKHAGLSGGAAKAAAALAGGASDDSDLAMDMSADDSSMIDFDFDFDEDEDDDQPGL